MPKHDKKIEVNDDLIKFLELQKEAEARRDRLRRLLKPLPKELEEKVKGLTGKEQKELEAVAEMEEGDTLNENSYTDPKILGAILDKYGVNPDDYTAAHVKIFAIRVIEETIGIYSVDEEGN